MRSPTLCSLCRKEAALKKKREDQEKKEAEIKQQYLVSILRLHLLAAITSRVSDATTPLNPPLPPLLLLPLPLRDDYCA